MMTSALTQNNFYFRIFYFFKNYQLIIWNDNILEIRNKLTFADKNTEIF